MLSQCCNASLVARYIESVVGVCRAGRYGVVDVVLGRVVDCQVKSDDSWATPLIDGGVCVVAASCVGLVVGWPSVAIAGGLLVSLCGAWVDGQVQSDDFGTSDGVGLVNHVGTALSVLCAVPVVHIASFFCDIT